MSKFSNYLRKLIDQSGESIASISRNAGIERTSIHKALKDERILSYKAMQILARYFGLCTEERQEFSACMTSVYRVRMPMKIVRLSVIF